VLLVERLQQQQQGPDAAADGDDEDLAVDHAWIAGTARSRPPKPLASSAAAASSAAGDGADADGDELCLSQMPASQGPSFSCSQAAPASQAAGSGGGRSGGSLQFSEHRSVRCSLVEAVWPELVAAYRCGPCVECGSSIAGKQAERRDPCKQGCAHMQVCEPPEATSSCPRLHLAWANLMLLACFVVR
jgi:hypothetical protein